MASRFLIMGLAPSILGALCFHPTQIVTPIIAGIPALKKPTKNHDSWRNTRKAGVLSRATDNWPHSGKAVSQELALIKFQCPPLLRHCQLAAASCVRLKER